MTLQTPPPPTPSAIPKPNNLHHEKEPETQAAKFTLPPLRFEARDTDAPGARRYFSTTDTSVLLRDAVLGVLSALYTPLTAPKNQRSISLILRSMPGVAYTTSSSLDPDQKEIHFSLDYISSIAPALATDEIRGVVRHEMVHVWQFNGLGTAPGGLIEGIADWVRLKAKLAPPHWRRGGSRWDEGYQNTAYFLDYLEARFGRGTVPRINEYLRNNRYSPSMWTTLFSGVGVDELYSDYRRDTGLDGSKAKAEEKGKEEEKKVVDVIEVVEVEVTAVVDA
ncbi:hypothetical protein RUND412_003624 [Rhizina undulata]